MQRIQGEYQLIGPPGTGKTTTVIEQARSIRERGQSVLICSLTRAAAHEIAARAEDLGRDAASTLHSHALRATEIPHDKLIPRHVKEWDEAHPDLAIHPDTEAPLEGRSTEDWHAQYHLLRALQRPRDLWPTSLHVIANTWEDWKRENDYYDFTDVLEQALHNPKGMQPTAPGRPNVIIADEAQDHSRLEFALLREWAKAAEGVILVGDPWQALYVWRGADPNVIDFEHPDEKHRILKKSYRIPRAVHEYATRWAKSLSTWKPHEYNPRDGEGWVTRLEATYRRPDEIVERAEYIISETHKTVMILGACGYHLNPVFELLKGYGIPYGNAGVSKENPHQFARWNPLTVGAAGRRIRMFAQGYHDVFDAQSGKQSPGWTWKEFAAWTEDLDVDALPWRRVDINEAAKNTPNNFIPIHEEVATPLRNLLADYDFDHWLDWFAAALRPSKRDKYTYPLRVASLHGIYALTDRPPVTVGTIHSAKGGEADHVFLFPDLSPSATRAAKMTEAGHDAVVRQFYVGVTRARQNLYLCEPFAPESAVRW
jgi:DNA helicase-2/ATP-dependent DNA helicase PcrA